MVWSWRVAAVVWSWRATRNSLIHCYLKVSAEFLPQQFCIPSWIDLALCSPWLKDFLKDFASYSLFHMFLVLRSALCSSERFEKYAQDLLKLLEKKKSFVWPLKTWLQFVFNMVSQLSSMTGDSFRWCIDYVPYHNYLK